MKKLTTRERARRAYASGKLSPLAKAGEFLAHGILAEAQGRAKRAWHATDCVHEVRWWWRVREWLWRIEREERT